MSAQLPVPGILLGSYPERHEWKGTPRLAALLDRLAHGVRGGPSVHRRFAGRVRELQSELRRHPPEVLQARTRRLRAHLARDGFTAECVTEAFALIALACGRKLDSDPYDTQLAAARVLLDGKLAELPTGEGKTLAGAIAAATAALAGVPVHVVTANDYLVERDASALRPLFDELELRLGIVTQQSNGSERRAAYACDIVYCTARELAFDYLRDRIAAPQRSELEQRAAGLASVPPPQRLMRGLCMAVIDEVDSILIDEARVPLILSQVSAGEGDQALYRHAWEFSARLHRGTHFVLDAGARSADLTDAGRIFLRGLATGRAQWLHQRHGDDITRMALTARHLLQRDRDYFVKEGKILIIDETTGRSALGRAWSHGLHQLVEIKEDCKPGAPATPMAQITYQRFFRRYLRLAGMSGTLTEARAELLAIYGVDVVPVPPRLPCRRVMLPARAFATRQLQWDSIVARVAELHERGRPILIGTDSLRDSEELSGRLASAGLPHTVLNARQDLQEAKVVACAGARGAITVSTNMAGRGTDIALQPPVWDMGGLHVISCQQNSARRIDRQLIGRCARKGEPGSFETFVALDGTLLAEWWPGRLLRRVAQGELSRLRWFAVSLLRVAQRAAERRQRGERKSLLRADQELSRWFAFSGPEA